MHPGTISCPKPNADAPNHKKAAIAAEKKRVMSPWFLTNSHHSQMTSADGKIESHSQNFAGIYAFCIMSNVEMRFWLPSLQTFGSSESAQACRE